MLMVVRVLGKHVGVDSGVFALCLLRVLNQVHALQRLRVCVCVCVCVCVRARVCARARISTRARLRVRAYEPYRVYVHVAINLTTRACSCL